MRNISLRTRTIITIAFSVFFIFIFMFLGNLSLSKKQIKNRFTNEIEQFKSLSTGCLYLPIKENQTEIVSEVLSGLLQKQDAVCIEIYFAKQKIDGEIKETTIPFSPTANHITTQMTLRPIDNTGVSAGYIKFYFDATSMQADFSAAQRNNWFLFILICRTVG